MKKAKRIFAIAGAALLAGLYLATLIFALIDHPAAFRCLKISIGFTILIPVLLWMHSRSYSASVSLTASVPSSFFSNSSPVF